MRLVAAALVSLGLTVCALAQAPQMRVRGVVEAMDGRNLTVKTPEGGSTMVSLAPHFAVGGVVKASAADIRTGSFIGVGARPQADGTLLAVQVFIFPEAMRGTGEGHRPWGVLPDSTMTNATVADTVTRIDGATVMLSYPGGEQKVAITPEANILMAAPAANDELVPGAQVAMTAVKQADGSLSASRITIAKAGAQLPY